MHKSHQCFMLFFFFLGMAACARGHRDFFVGGASAELYLLKNIWELWDHSQLPLCMNVCACKYLCMRERDIKKVRKREQQQKTENSENTELDLLQYWCCQRSAANANTTTPDAFWPHTVCFFFLMYFCIYRSIPYRNSFLLHVSPLPRWLLPNQVRIRLFISNSLISHPPRLSPLFLFPRSFFLLHQ